LATSIGGKLVISIAAGVRLDALSRWLGGHRQLVRCMPNTPALIGAGITGVYALPEVDAAARQRAESILAAVGEVVWVKAERLLDVVTAVSGSGPAYVFWLIEQLAAFAEREGIAAPDALRLARQCVLGSARLAQDSAEPPAQLRKNVTSKGGTTEAALRVFEEEKLAERFARALAAATQRGGELGDVLGKD
jgi:pyrroline-5-carboxylate reductase